MARGRDPGHAPACVPMPLRSDHGTRRPSRSRSPHYPRWLCRLLRPLARVIVGAALQRPAAAARGSRPAGLDDHPAAAGVGRRNARRPWRRHRSARRAPAPPPAPPGPSPRSHSTAQPVVVDLHRVRFRKRERVLHGEAVPVVVGDGEEGAGSSLRRDHDLHRLARIRGREVERQAAATTCQSSALGRHRRVDLGTEQRGEALGAQRPRVGDGGSRNIPRSGR